MQNPGGPRTGLREGGKEQQAAEVHPEPGQGRGAHRGQRHPEMVRSGRAGRAAGCGDHQPENGEAGRNRKPGHDSQRDGR